MFRIKLKKAHDATGLSPYRVWKLTGVAQNTIRKYVDVDEVIADRIESVVVRLAEFYGVDWRDPEVVEVVQVGEDKDSPEIKIPAPAIA